MCSDLSQATIEIRRPFASVASRLESDSANKQFWSKPKQKLLLPLNTHYTECAVFRIVEAFGDSAVELSEVTRVGSEFLVEGSLWNRSYTNRQGFKVFEVKVVAGRVQQPGSENWFVFEKRSPGEAETHKASC